LSLWSAKTAGISGHNPTTQAESSTSTWYAFAGHVNPESMKPEMGKAAGASYLPDQPIIPSKVVTDAT
jgi:hypothetical protein